MPSLNLVTAHLLSRRSGLPIATTSSWRSLSPKVSWSLALQLIPENSVLFRCTIFWPAAMQVGYSEPICTVKKCWVFAQLQTLQSCPTMPLTLCSFAHQRLLIRTCYARVQKRGLRLLSSRQPDTEKRAKKVASSKTNLLHLLTNSEFCWRDQMVREWCLRPPTCAHRLSRRIHPLGLLELLVKAETLSLVS